MYKKTVNLILVLLFIFTITGTAQANIIDCKGYQIWQIGEEDRAISPMFTDLNSLKSWGEQNLQPKGQYQVYGLDSGEVFAISPIFTKGKLSEWLSNQADATNSVNRNIIITAAIFVVIILSAMFWPSKIAKRKYLRFT